MIIEAEIDLHEQHILTAEELRYFVNSFIQNSYDSDFKCIRIITGRGLHSKNKPLLKPLTESILKTHKLVADYRMDGTLGAFEISLVS